MSCPVLESWCFIDQGNGRELERQACPPLSSHPSSFFYYIIVHPGPLPVSLCTVRCNAIQGTALFFCQNRTILNRILTVIMTPDMMMSRVRCMMCDWVVQMSARPPDCDFSLGSKPIPMLLCAHTHNPTCCLYLHILFGLFAQNNHY